MLDADLAHIRAHRNDIHRYRQLLHTRLSDLERQFIERRMPEEQALLDALAAETFPIASAVNEEARGAGRPRERAMSELRDPLEAP